MKRAAVFLAIIAVFLSVGLLLEKEMPKIGEYDEKVPLIAEFYRKTQIKKTKKEIARKIYSREFSQTVENLDLNKLEAVNYLVGRDELRGSMNSKTKVEELQKIDNPNVNFRDAEYIFTISRELNELGGIDPGIKFYLNKIYEGFDYEEFAKNGDNIINYIRNKELIASLLPKSMGEVIKQLPPKKAENIMKILEGAKIPSSVDFTTRDFIDLRLGYEDMDMLYKLSSKLYKIGAVEQKFLEEANKLYMDLDYTRIARYGNFYLNEKKALEEIADNYSQGEFDFEVPFVGMNPYGRVPNMALIKYPGVENEKVEITVVKREGGTDLKYVQNGKDFLTIYGLYMDGKENSIILKSGKKSTEIKIPAISIPDEFPVIVINEAKPEADNFYYATYINSDIPYGIVIDKTGRIRYVMDPADTKEGIWRLIKTDTGFLFYNADIVIEYDFQGKILKSDSRFNYENEFGNLKERQTGDLTSVTLLHDDNKKAVVTEVFNNEVYPSAFVRDIELGSKNTLFQSTFYLDKNEAKKNTIIDGDIFKLNMVD